MTRGQRSAGIGHSSSWMLGLSETSSYAVFVYLCIFYFGIYIFVFAPLTHENKVLISFINPVFMNLPHTGSFWHFVICCNCVFCICILVFVHSAQGNIIFNILEQSSFQNYTTWWVFLTLCHVLYSMYLCISICVFVIETLGNI